MGLNLLQSVWIEDIDGVGGLVYVSDLIEALEGVGARRVTTSESDPLKGRLDTEPGTYLVLKIDRERGET